VTEVRQVHFPGAFHLSAHETFFPLDQLFFFSPLLESGKGKKKKKFDFVFFLFGFKGT